MQKVRIIEDVESFVKKGVFYARYGQICTLLKLQSDDIALLEHENGEKFHSRETRFKYLTNEEILELERKKAQEAKGKDDRPNPGKTLPGRGGENGGGMHSGGSVTNTDEPKVEGGNDPGHFQEDGGINAGVSKQIPPAGRKEVRDTGRRNSSRKNGQAKTTGSGDGKQSELF